MKIVLISGKARHGKDTVAGMLDDILKNKGNKVLITHYGDLLKYICKNFFNWNGVKDDKGRTILQYVGTDVIRQKNPDMWVDFIIKILTYFNNTWDYVLIPDCRFPNEVDKIKKYFDCVHLRIIRTNFISPLSVEQQNHISETALDNYDADYNLFNSSSLEDLKIYCENFCENILTKKGNHNG